MALKRTSVSADIRRLLEKSCPSEEECIAVRNKLLDEHDRSHGLISIFADFLWHRGFTAVASHEAFKSAVKQSEDKLSEERVLRAALVQMWGEDFTRYILGRQQMKEKPTSLDVYRKLKKIASRMTLAMFKRLANALLLIRHWVALESHGQLISVSDRRSILGEELDHIIDYTRNKPLNYRGHDVTEKVFDAIQAWHRGTIWSVKVFDRPLPEVLTDDTQRRWNMLYLDEQEMLARRPESYKPAQPILRAPISPACTLSSGASDVQTMVASSPACAELARPHPRVMSTPHMLGPILDFNAAHQLPSVDSGFEGSGESRRKRLDLAWDVDEVAASENSPIPSSDGSTAVGTPTPGCGKNERFLFVDERGGFDTEVAEISSNGSSTDMDVDAHEESGGESPTTQTTLSGDRTTIEPTTHPTTSQAQLHPLIGPQHAGNAFFNPPRAMVRQVYDQILAPLRLPQPSHLTRLGQCIGQDEIDALLYRWQTEAGEDQSASMRRVRDLWVSPVSARHDGAQFVEETTATAGDTAKLTNDRLAQPLVKTIVIRSGRACESNHSQRNFQSFVARLGELNAATVSVLYLNRTESVERSVRQVVDDMSNGEPMIATGLDGIEPDALPKKVRDQFPMLESLMRKIHDHDGWTVQDVVGRVRNALYWEVVAVRGGFTGALVDVLCGVWVHVCFGTALLATTPSRHDQGHLCELLAHGHMWSPKEPQQVIALHENDIVYLPSGTIYSISAVHSCRISFQLVLDESDLVGTLAKLSPFSCHEITSLVSKNISPKLATLASVLLQRIKHPSVVSPCGDGDALQSAEAVLHALSGGSDAEPPCKRRRV